MFSTITSLDRSKNVVIEKPRSSHLHIQRLEALEAYLFNDSIGAKVESGRSAMTWTSSILTILTALPFEM